MGVGDRYAAHVDRIELRRTSRRRVRQYLQPRSRTERTLRRVDGTLLVALSVASLHTWEWASVFGVSLLAGVAATLMGRKRWSAAEAADSDHVT